MHCDGWFRPAAEKGSCTVQSLRRLHLLPVACPAQFACTLHWPYMRSPVSSALSARIRDEKRGISAGPPGEGWALAQGIFAPGLRARSNACVAQYPCLAEALAGSQQLPPIKLAVSQDGRWGTPNHLMVKPQYQHSSDTTTTAMPADDDDYDFNLLLVLLL